MKNLIEVVGYDKANQVFKDRHDEAKYYVHEQSKVYDDLFGFYADKMFVGVHNPNTHFNLKDLEQDLLNYRREHGVYEVGDLVTGRDNFRIGNIHKFMEGSVWVVFDSSSKMLTPIWNIRHATPEEIKAGHRL